MVKVLLVCDRPDWAYDAIAKALIKHNPYKDVILDLSYMKGDTDLYYKINNHDFIFVLGWQIMGQIKWLHVKNIVPLLNEKRTLTGIHSYHAWDDRKTQPDTITLPPKKLVRFLNKYRSVNAVSSRLYQAFKTGGVKNLFYTPNGADIEVFYPKKKLREKRPLRVGYSGSLKHDWRKGITEIIEPASVIAGVELVKAMPSDGHYVPLDQMPDFYNEIDVYLCASTSEGFSLSVLEASATGRPVISTRVGGCEDLIVNGQNGFLVDRTPEAFAEKLIQLDRNRDLLCKMGSRNREIVEQKWSWAKRSQNWLNFILDSVGKAS
jgi:glycosyltransferase involved in cell wall biosynthesis